MRLRARESRCFGRRRSQWAEAGRRQRRGTCERRGACGVRLTGRDGGQRLWTYEIGGRRLTKLGEHRRRGPRRIVRAARRLGCDRRLAIVARGVIRLAQAQRSERRDFERTGALHGLVTCILLAADRLRRLRIRICLQIVRVEVCSFDTLV